MSDDYYGPSLPPGFQPGSEEAKEKTAATAPDRPSLIGPELPDHLMRKLLGTDEDNSTQPSQIGPQLPEHLKRKLEQVDDDDDKQVIGPKCPKSSLDVSLLDPEEEESSEEDDDIIGPMPATAPQDYNVAAMVEQRAQKMKEKLLNEGKDGADGPQEREEWMTQLPEDVGKKIVGVGPSRGFSRKAEVGEYDREGWTATPGKSRQHSSTTSKSGAAATMAQQARDLQQQEFLQKYNNTTSSKKSGGPKSLMEIHQNNLKKKKLEEGDKVPQRKEFDRDTEMGLHNYNPDNTRKTIQNSRQLGSRFSSGSQKFL